MQESGLTNTLSFGLDIRTGSPDELHDANQESRRVRNEVNRLDRNGWDWDDIEDVVVARSNHVKNTTQLLVQKSFTEIETYHDNKQDGWGRPHPYIHEPYPTRMNHGEGYSLSLNEETGDVKYRISSEPYNHVKGILRGSPGHLDRVKTALNNDDWRVGTAELVHKHGEWRLHVTVTHETRAVASPDDAETIIGVDVNEDCIALAAMTRTGSVEDSLVIDYPDVKERRHEYFTKRKRMQQAGQTAFETVVKTEESDFVHDQIHKVSRDVIDWVSRFQNPVIVFEDLEDMRESTDYGTRMNRRLHSLPFATLQEKIAYKAAWDGIPSVHVDPAYTSQRCPRTVCRYASRSNRRKKRFKCRACGFQDHADRKAAVCVVQEWLGESIGNVPSLETLPRVKKVRRTASGLREEADSHGHGLCSGVTDAVSARDSQSQAREELNSVASTGD